METRKPNEPIHMEDQREQEDEAQVTADEPVPQTEIDEHNDSDGQ